jgi:hypothetical protein
MLGTGFKSRSIQYVPSFSRCTTSKFQRGRPYTLNGAAVQAEALDRAQVPSCKTPMSRPDLGTLTEMQSHQGNVLGKDVNNVRDLTWPFPVRLPLF